MAPQTAISKAVCYKTKNEQLWEKAVHFLLVATNCFYAGLPTVFCTITVFLTQVSSFIVLSTTRQLHSTSVQLLHTECLRLLQLTVTTLFATAHVTLQV